MSKNPIERGWRLRDSLFGRIGIVFERFMKEKMKGEMRKMDYGHALNGRVPLVSQHLKLV